ncbi:GNAT family N-acetyltransferase, partial [Variovorax sp. YR752]|uniref:GNAT family N-acetyltransferase n=1 Tax=Variovorax sp. YR752 TaxID=1884383 RepID=UPI003137DE88
DVSVVGAGIPPALARETLVRHIASESPRWDTVNMALAKSGASAEPGFAHALAHNGFTAHPYFQYENWTHATQGQCFDAYYQERPSQVRNTIQRRQKKLDKAHRSEITVTRGTEAGLDDAIDAFCKVYNASWKEPEPFPAFIPGLIRCAARLGVLRLGVLRVDGQAAAAQLWINASGRAVIYKLAYDEKYAEFGVGSILSKELFRIAIDEDGVGEIDYGVGSEAYKKDWMTSNQSLVGTEAFNRSTVVGLALGMAEASKQRLRLLRRAFHDRAGLSKA